MFPIPANATRIRYLESTGTQYIDTGVAYDSSVVFDADFAKTASTSNGGVFFGILWASGASSTIRRWCVSYVASRNKCQAYYYTTTNFFHPTMLPSVRFSLDANATDLTVDGTSRTVTSSTFDPTVDVNIYVFARHTYAPDLDPNPVSSLQSARLYACRIYKSGTLVRSFVPVRVGSTGYLFDRVSGKLFGNAGTGDFVLGPDTFAQGVVPTRMMAMGVRKKPYDAEIEYLESTGKQYIDTGIVPDSTTIMDVSGLFVQGKDTTRLGVRDSSNNFAFNNVSSTQIRVDFGSGRVTGWTVPTSKNLSRVTIDSTTKTALANTVDGESYSHSYTSSPPSGSLAIPLFAWRNGGTRIYSNGMRVSRAMFWKSGTPVRDYIPVRVGTTGYLFDRVTRRLYGNAGTRAFTIGPDKTA